MTIINPTGGTTYVSDGYRGGKVISSIYGDGAPMSPVFVFDNIPSPACLTSIAATQTLVSAGTVTLAAGPGNTTVVFRGTGGVIQLDCPRAISITGTGTPTIFTITGWDQYGIAMTETITLPTGTSTVYGKKAWAYVASITAGNAATSFSVGCADIFGLPYVAADQNYITPRWNGYTDLTSPAVLSGISAAMVSGVVTVANPNVKANSVIVTTANTKGAGTQGYLQAAVADIVPGVSFTIRSLQANGTAQTADVSTVNWEILDPSDYCGSATLVMPVSPGPTSVTVSCPVVTANSIIQIFRGTGAVSGGNLGNISVGTITAGTSFVIQSDSNNDVSTIYWKIVNTNFVLANSPVNLSQKTLAGASTVVSTPYVTANSVIQVSVQTDTGAGIYAVPQASIVAGTSFTITSTGGGGDTSVVYWRIINPSTMGTFAPADDTDPATATTGDVRATYKPSSVSDGIKRLTIYLYVRGADIVADAVGVATSNTALLNSLNNEVGVLQYPNTTR